MEESSEQREQIYEKLVLLYEKNNDQEKAWEVCSQGIEELKDSGTLRIQFIRMQCQNSGTDRQICAQTIQKYLKEVPGIASDEEFKKLKAIYDIKVEGDECMGRKIAGQLLVLILLLAVLYQHQDIFAQDPDSGMSGRLGRSRRMGKRKKGRKPSRIPLSSTG